MRAQMVEQLILFGVLHLPVQFTLADNTNKCLQVFKDTARISAIAAIDEDAFQLITYLEFLLDKNVISVDHLETFAQGLEAGQIINPLATNRASSQSEHFIFRQNIDGLIANVSRSTTVQMLAWVKTRIRELTQRNVEQSETKDHTTNSIIFRPMKFNFVSKGDYRLRNDKGEIRSEVKLTQDIEVGDTAVTQYQWVDTMHHNPTYFPNQLPLLEHLEQMTINDKAIFLRPNYPVANISCWSAIVFVNELSKRKNLKPAYN